MSANKIPTSSVHGRFQPLHNEHLEYILTAFDRSAFVYVGITQFDRAHLLHVAEASSHRQEASSNPLTYFERTELIALALQAAGIAPDRYRILPFPIERPDDLADYLPLDIPILTTRVDGWNDTKVDLLKRLGYTVEVMFSRDPKGVSGSEIRDLMGDEDPTWESMVPEATVEYLRSLHIADRLA